MQLFKTQTAAEMAASEEKLYLKKFTYGLAIAGGIGMLVYAVQKNKKNKAFYAVGGLAVGLLAGFIVDGYVNNLQKPASVVVDATTSTNNS